MSEVWDDIGGGSKKSDDPIKVVRKRVWHIHESDELTAKRASKCLEAIFRLDRSAEIQADGMVISIIDGKRFHFWPSSDCWYSESKRVYGRGIEKLCQQIQQHLGA